MTEAGVQGRENALDWLRLAAAVGVVFGHLYGVPHDLGVNNHPTLLNGFPAIGVATFFIISGYVNYLSLERNPSPGQFYIRRVFRIMPAYFAVISIQTIIFFWTFRHQVATPVLIKYFVFNSVTLNFVQPSFVPGIFAINGALWTIKVEMSYYVILPLLMPLLKKRWFVFLGIAASVLYNLVVPTDNLAKQLPGEIYGFLLGVALARRLLPLPTLAWGALAMASVVAFLFSYYGNWPFRVGDVDLFGLSLALASVAFFARVAARPPPLDLSYSIYLVHFPIMIFAYAVLHARYSAATDALIVAAAGLFALALSVSIERPGMNLGRLAARAFGRMHADAVGAEVAATSTLPLG